jgi:hypothetical protein
VLSVFPSVAALGLVALAAARLAWQRTSPVPLAPERISASRALALATAVQCAHFAEEWITGFHIEFPALFGLEPMALSVFVAFNIAWIAFWLMSIPAIRLARRTAFFAAWFLAIAGVLNGIAHPLIAVGTAGYFPGLISSPFTGLACLVLWQRLQSATAS